MLPPNESCVTVESENKINIAIWLLKCQYVESEILGGVHIQ